jgi:hypothetical protein
MLKKKMLKKNRIKEGRIELMNQGLPSNELKTEGTMKKRKVINEKKKQAMLDVYFLSELAIKKDEVNPSLYYKRKEELKRIQKQVEKGY